MTAFNDRGADSEPTAPHDFDPYSEWFGIPPGPRPPGPEALLGLQPGESDADVILEASMNRHKRLKEFALSLHYDLARRLESEVSRAMVLLTSRGSVPGGSEAGSKTISSEGERSRDESPLPPPLRPAPSQPASQTEAIVSNLRSYLSIGLRRCDDFLRTLAGEGNRGWLQFFRCLTVTTLVTWCAVFGLLLVLLARGLS